MGRLDSPRAGRTAPVRRWRAGASGTARRVINPLSMASPSSQDLHPAAGARFTFERTEPGTYRVTVFLPRDEQPARLEASLRWTDDGKAILSDHAPDPWPGEWPGEETLKLARVLKKDPKSRLTRWRPNPTD